MDDLLLLDDRGFLAESSTANVFLVRRGALHTPTTYACLDGITRRIVIGLAPSSTSTSTSRRAGRADLPPSLLAQADEIFLTGTGIELLPVLKDGAPVGGGAPGPLTQALSADYRALVAAQSVAI